LESLFRLDHDNNVEQAAAMAEASSSPNNSSDIDRRNSDPGERQGTEEEREARALLGWVRAVDDAIEEGILSRHVVQVDDLCDGVAFFDILGAV
jgi:hypothetical protein